jgi:hypothetical protein
LRLIEFIARHELNEEAITLLTTALSALVDAAQVFPSIIKADLHACILHIFASILGTGACQATVVPQALPIFKRFITSLAPQAEATEDTSKQLRATLTRFLAILRHAQQREFDAALACEKNSVLATTILLSSMPDSLRKWQQAAVALYFFCRREEFSRQASLRKCSRKSFFSSPTHPTLKAWRNRVPH